MDLKLDILKQFRELIDWVKKNIAEAKTAAGKKKLNVLVNSIAKLIENKQKYLSTIDRHRSDPAKQWEAVSVSLKIAEDDTRKLLNDLESTGLEADKLGLELHAKLNALAQLKIDEVQAFQLATGSTEGKVEEIRNKLSSYHAQWMAIGKEIELLRKELT